MNNLETQALNHLNLVLGSQHEWATLVGIKNGAKTRILPFTNNRIAAQEAIRLSELGYNVFFTPNTMSTKPINGRGVESDFTTQNAIVVDIDISGCDKHSNRPNGSTTTVRYAKSIEEAISLLNISPTFIVNSGYGIHAYYLLEDTSKCSKEIACKLIKSVKLHAKQLGLLGVDSTYSLDHLFRLCGTKNYKKVNGSIPKKPPICSIIRLTDTKYTLDSLNKCLADTLDLDSNFIKANPATSKDTQWVQYFFKRISANRLSYEQWRNAIWIGHAYGMPLADLDAWSSLDSARYAGTGSIEKLISEYRDNGLGVGTLINYLKELEPDDPFIVPLTYEGYSIQLHYFYGKTLKYVLDTNQWALYENGMWYLYNLALPGLSKIAVNMTRTLKAMNTFSDKSICKFIDAWTDSVVFEKVLKIYGGLHLVRSTDFNTHRDLLNVSNGVVDLRTGELLPHNSEYFFTYKLDTPYIPLSNISRIGGSLSDPPTTARPADTSSSAPSISDAEGVLNVTQQKTYSLCGIQQKTYSLPTSDAKGVLRSGVDLPDLPTSDAKGVLNTDLLTVQRFFKSILPDTDTRNALLRYLGYCLTGEIGEQKALFIYGRGANGKSVLLNTMKKLLGSLSTFSDSGLLTENTYLSGKPTTRFLPLKNIRLAIISEQERSAQINSSQFKLLIGEQYLKIRPMYSEEQVIPIYFKLILSGNYQMDLTDSNDLGIQRRILQINFLQDFSKTGDPRLLNKLTTPNALTALLSLLVEQSKLYYKEGLLESKDMKKVKEEYIYSNDFISEFVDKYCIKEGKVKCKVLIELLMNKYPQECKDYNYKDLLKLLQNIPGVTKSILDGYLYFRGISIK